MLASAVDHQNFLAPDLCDPDYHQIFTLHTTDYHAPPDPEQYKDSTLRKFKRKLPQQRSNGCEDLVYIMLLL